MGDAYPADTGLTRHGRPSPISTLSKSATLSNSATLSSQATLLPGAMQSPGGISTASTTDNVRGLNHQGLPSGVQKVLPIDPKFYCQEVQDAISKHSLLCHVPTCSRCLFRQRRAQQEISEAQHAAMNRKTASEQEVELHHFSLGVPSPQEIVDRGEVMMYPKNFYDVRKCRALFGLGLEPQYDYATGGPMLDKKTYIRNNTPILYEHQIADVTQQLRMASALNVTNAQFGTIDAQGEKINFASHVAEKSGQHTSAQTATIGNVASKAHRYKAAIDWIRQLENRSQEDEAEDEAVRDKEWKGNPTNDESLKLDVGILLTALSAAGLGILVMKNKSARIIERIRALTMDTPDRTKSKGRRQQGQFQLVDWRRATEHCVVLVQGLAVPVGEDRQWTFVINDSLQDDWPWQLVATQNHEAMLGRRCTMTKEPLPEQGHLSFTMNIENLNFDSLFRQLRVHQFEQELAEAVAEDIRINTPADSPFSKMKAALVDVKLAGGQSGVKAMFAVHLPNKCRLKSLHSIMLSSASLRRTLMSTIGGDGQDKLMLGVIFDNITDVIPVEPLFKGLLLGVTTKPYRIGPLEWGTTLSGIRSYDGHVLHQGREHTLFSDIDVDATGTLDQGEFAAVYRPAGSNEIFNQMDCNGNKGRGKINEEQFKVALQRHTINGVEFRCPFFDPKTGLLSHRVACDCCPHGFGDIAPETRQRVPFPRVTHKKAKEIQDPFASDLTPLLTKRNISTLFKKKLAANYGTADSDVMDDNDMEIPKIHVTMRLDRRLRKGDGGFHSRLWMQLKGQEPQVLVEDMQIDDAAVAFPAVYASRPPIDVHKAVRIHSGNETWQTGAEKCCMTQDQAKQLSIQVMEVVKIKSMLHDSDGNMMFMKMLSSLWGGRLDGSKPSKDDDDAWRVDVDLLDELLLEWRNPQFDRERSRGRRERPWCGSLCQILSWVEEEYARPAASTLHCLWTLAKKRQLRKGAELEEDACLIFLETGRLTSTSQDILLRDGGGRVWGSRLLWQDAAMKYGEDGMESIFEAEEDSVVWVVTEADYENEHEHWRHLKLSRQRPVPDTFEGWWFFILGRLRRHDEMPPNIIMDLLHYLLQGMMRKSGKMYDKGRVGLDKIEAEFFAAWKIELNHFVSLSRVNKDGGRSAKMCLLLELQEREILHVNGDDESTATLSIEAKKKKVHGGQSMARKSFSQLR